MFAAYAPPLPALESDWGWDTLLGSITNEDENLIRKPKAKEQETVGASVKKGAKKASGTAKAVVAGKAPPVPKVSVNVGGLKIPAAVIENETLKKTKPKPKAVGFEDDEEDEENEEEGEDAVVAGIAGFDAPVSGAVLVLEYNEIR